MLVIRRLYSRRVSGKKHQAIFENPTPSLHPDSNPGISRTVNLLRKEGHELNEMEDFEDTEGNEAEFFNLHKSFKDHVKELQRSKEQEKYLIIKQKYFKIKLPNFLTWHDKEHIRYLHNTDSEEWNIEKLSEGFPATPDIIKKIVKGKWSKKNEMHVYKHDQKVLENWQQFKAGKITDLPPQLSAHLQKFSSRTLNFEPFKSQDDKRIVVKTIKEQSAGKGEFSQIIDSYKKLKMKQSEDNTENESCNLIELSSETNLVQASKLGRKTVTLKKLQAKLEARGEQISLNEKMIKDAEFPKKESHSVLETPEKLPVVEKTENKNKAGLVVKNTKDLSHLIYPEQIIIPKQLYKRGYTYKLNDCYYDSDGLFLYRVPGMC